MSDVQKLRIVTSGKVEPAWRDFYAHISGSPEYRVIEVAGGGIDLLLAVKSEEPVAVILHGASEKSGISSHLFSQFPDLTILKLYASGQAFLEQRCPTERQVVPADIRNLSDALRLAVEDPCPGGYPI